MGGNPRRSLRTFSDLENKMSHSPGRDEGRRGAKVRHKTMSDSAEHLQDNVRVSQTLEKNPGAVKSS